MQKAKKMKQQREEKIKPKLKQKDRPEWTTTFGDQDQFKLTPSEMMQKKISHTSKHRLEARDSWQNVQEKLQKGIMDEDTNKIFETALTSKGLGLDKYGVTRRNLTQMMQYEDTKRVQKETSFLVHDSNIEEIIDNQNILDIARNLLNRRDAQRHEDKDFIKNIKLDLDDTKQLIKKVEKINLTEITNNPGRSLKRLQSTSSRKESKNNSKNISRQGSGKENQSPKNALIQELMQDIFKPVKLEDRYNYKDIDDTCLVMRDIFQNNKNDLSSFQVNDQSQIFDRTQINKSKVVDQKLSFLNPRIDLKNQVPDDWITHKRNQQMSQESSQLLNLIGQKSSRIEDQIPINDRYTKRTISEIQFLEPVSPSKFFDHKCQDTRISYINMKQPENSKFEEPYRTDPNEKYDLESLRIMLEETRLDLDKMNLNTSLLACNPVNQLQTKNFTQVQVNPKFVPFLPDQHVYEQEEDFQPRSFTISQHKMKENIQLMTRKIKRPGTSLNINDYM